VDLFFLLLDYIQQLTLVSNILRLLEGVRVASIAGVRLESLDLHTLLHVMLKLASFRLQLLVLGDLVLDLFLELTFHLLDVLDTLVAVSFELLDLLVKSSLVILFLLDVFALNDLLGLFGDTVELHIFSSLLEISDLQLQTFILVHDFFKLLLVLEDSGHILDLCITLILDVSVLLVNIILQDQDSVLVVSSNRFLGHLYLTLLEVNDHFKVILQLLNPADGLGLLPGHISELLIQLTDLSIVPLDEVLQVLKALVVCFLGLVHLDTLITLLDNLIELFFDDGWARSISFVVIDFLLLHLLDDLVHSE